MPGVRCGAVQCSRASESARYQIRSRVAPSLLLLVLLLLLLIQIKLPYGAGWMGSVAPAAWAFLRGRPDMELDTVAGRSGALRCGLPERSPCRYWASFQTSKRVRPDATT